MPNNDNGISLHASANPHAGPEGFMKLGDIKGEFQLTQPLTGSAGSGGSTSLRSENRFVFEAPKNDGLLVPAGYDFASFGLEANERVGGVGKGTFTTGAGGDSIVHPQYNVGEDGRMIVHPQYNDGEETLPTGTIISYEDSHLSAKDLIGRPPDPKIAPPAPHVSDRAAVIDGGSDSYTEVEWTYFASRQEVFARMGR